MVDSEIILLHNTEMAEHANGAAHQRGALLGGRYVTKELTHDMIDFFAGTKVNIESCPYATQEQKDAKIHRRENLMRILKPQMGL
jgi:hypothetical protein